MRGPIAMLLGAAGQAAALTAFGLVLQFVVRLQMTARLGAGEAYDAFLAAMVPATMIAQVGFQAVASALVPRLGAMIVGGRVEAARHLYRRAVRGSLVLWSAVVAAGWLLARALFGAEHPYGPGYPELLLLVMVAWGCLGGWAILQRQLLIYGGRYGAATAAGMAAPVLMAAAGLVPGAGVREFVAAGVAGQVATVVVMARLAARSWQSAPAAAGAGGAPAREGAAPPEGLSAVGLAALPILLASFNAQAMGMIDQVMAAWWQVGGLTLLSVALAVARLPHTLADNVTASTCYRALVEAAGRRQLGEAGAREGLAAVHARMLRQQALLVWPAAVALLVGHREIVEVLYLRGRFDAAAAEGAASILACYAACAPAFVLQGVQVQVIVVLGKAGTALRYEIVMTVLSAGLNALLLPWVGLPGLVLSTAVSTAIVARLIARAIDRLDVGVTWRGSMAAIVAPTAAAGVAAGAGAAILALLPPLGAVSRLLLLAAVVTPAFYGTVAVLGRSGGRRDRAVAAAAIPAAVPLPEAMP